MEGSNTHAFQLFGKKCEFLKKRGYVTPPTLEGDFVYQLYNTTLGMNVEVDKSIKGTSYQVLLGDGMKGSLTHGLSEEFNHVKRSKSSDFDGDQTLVNLVFLFSVTDRKKFVRHSRIKRCSQKQ